MYSNKRDIAIVPQTNNNHVSLIIGAIFVWRLIPRSEKRETAFISFIANFLMTLLGRPKQCLLDKSWLACRNRGHSTAHSTLHIVINHRFLENANNQLGGCYFRCWNRLVMFLLMSYNGSSPPLDSHVLVFISEITKSRYVYLICESKESYHEFIIYV